MWETSEWEVLSVEAFSVDGMEGLGIMTTV